MVHCIVKFAKDTSHNSIKSLHKEALKFMMLVRSKIYIRPMCIQYSIKTKTFLGLLQTFQMHRTLLVSKSITFLRIQLRAQPNIHLQLIPNVANIENLGYSSL